MWVELTRVALFVVGEQARHLLRRLLQTGGRPRSRQGAVTNKAHLCCTTAGATIHYTINGSEPTTPSTEYDSSGIELLAASSSGIKAIR